MEPLLGTFHNAETGETIVRELTSEEIAELPHHGLLTTEEIAAADE